MEELRASLRIEKWVLMPHSFGGIIATAYARKHPERGAGMVMGMLGQARLTGKMMYADDATEMRVAAATKGRPANRDFAMSLFASSAIDAYLRDMTPDTASLEMPVLVVGGRNDHVTGVDHYKRIAVRCACSSELRKTVP